MDEEAPIRRPMDTPLLVGTAAGGAVLGVLSSFGLLAGTLELIAWLVLATAALIATLRRIPEDAFRHLMFGLMLAGFVAADAKILLWQRFLSNHQELVNRTVETGVESVPRTAVVISDTLTGVLFGLLAGGVATYMVRRRPPSSRVMDEEEE